MGRQRIEQEEGAQRRYMMATQARGALGVSKATMSKMLAEGDLRWKQDALDRRIKWVEVSDVQRLLNQSPRAQKRKAQSLASQSRSNGAPASRTTDRSPGRRTRAG